MISGITENIGTLSSKELEFKNHVQAGVEAWQKAGRILVELEAENSNIIRDLSDKTGIEESILRQFLLIGKRQLYPYLLISKGDGIKRLRSMDYELQVKHWAEPVELLVNNAGNWEELRVDVRNLTKDQAAQVFDSAAQAIRTTPAQRAYLADKVLKQHQRNAVPVSADVLPYRIVRKRLEITRACTFTKKDLAHLLAEMED